MSFAHRWLTSKLAVAPQLSLQDVAEVKAAGFQSVICNRPDFEDGPGSAQATQAELAAACEALGLAFAYHPVSSGGHTEAQALHMGELMAKLPTPMLAFCRSGNRCIGLISLAKSLGQTVPE
ncbi:MAG: hypothetical protein RLY30_1904 [Pseudomonadota bacterium]|jgi:uncharacterized protein (TIGR01244 family)